MLRLPQLRQGTLAGFLNTLTTTSVITLATLYLQDTLGRRPLAAAAMLLPFSLAVIGGSTLAAAALRRARPRRVVGAGLATIADLVLIWAAPSPWALPACVATAGVGIGLSSVAATGLGTDVDRAWRGTAAGIINTAAQTGYGARHRRATASRRHHRSHTRPRRSGPGPGVGRGGRRRPSRSHRIHLHG